mmetsp:Transcript_27074/g.37691  ORF Transcript_27074/g.37691 Transcript_27074/m.37691 type:complete len:143 (+) Transcript_27074:400-828(+)
MLSFKQFLVCIAIGYIMGIIPEFEGCNKFREAFQAALTLFISYDKKSRGVIEHKDMIDTFKEMGETSVASERMKELDPDGDGYITFIEYLTAFQEWVGIEDEEVISPHKTKVEVKSSHGQAPSISAMEKKKHKKTGTGVHFE